MTRPRIIRQKLEYYCTTLGVNSDLTNVELSHTYDLTTKHKVRNLFSLLFNFIVNFGLYSKV